MADTGHVQIFKLTNDFVCYHCGKTSSMGLPADLDVVISAMNKFKSSHKRCKRTVNGSALEADHARRWLEYRLEYQQKHPESRGEVTHDRSSNGRDEQHGEETKSIT